jgi:signal transduction histidine kinase
VITLDLEDAKRIFLAVEDSGVGFDPSQARPLPGHLGLASMQERVEALGGTLTIDSKPGKGTRLQVVIALEQEVEHA